MQQNDRPLSLAEKWEHETLANNFIFCAVMEENPDLCKRLLEILLHIEIERLEVVQSEKYMKADFLSKGIRFDVYTKSEGAVFDIEVQTTNRSNLQKRARYYQSLMDVDSLEKGANYNELNDSYVIFLCLDDVFGRGLPVYTFGNLCLEDNTLALNDGAHKLFFNASKYDIMKTDEEKSFFKLLLGRGAETDFTRQLAQKVAVTKQNAQLRVRYMTWEQEMKDQVRIRAQDLAQDLAQNMAQELAQNMAQNLAKDMAQEFVHDIIKEKARHMLEDGQSAENVAKWMNLALEEVVALQA